MIEIKNKLGNLVYSASITQNAVYKKELMKEEYILLPFSSDVIVQFSKGDYIETEFGKFELVYIDKPEESNGFNYNLKFYSIAEKFKNRLFFYDRQGRKEKAWSLTGTIAQFGSLVISNLSIFGTYTVSADSTLTASKSVSFDSTSIFDALTSIAQAFETEWWIADKIIHFSKCEYGSEVILEKDKQITAMSAQSGDKGKAITRLFPFGSTRNIPNDYRCKQAVTMDVVQDKIAGIYYSSSFVNYITFGNKYPSEALANKTSTEYWISKVLVKFLSGALKGKIYGLKLGSYFDTYKPEQYILLDKDGNIAMNDLKLLKGGEDVQIYNYTTQMPANFITKKVIQEADNEYDDSNLVVGGVVEKRLMLPRAKGDHIDAYPNLKDEDVIEGVVAFEDVYPKYVGTISEVFLSEKELYDEEEVKGVKVPWRPYEFTDSGIDFKNSYIQKNGDGLKIKFESGALQGFTFKAEYDETTKRFQLWRNESKIPNDSLKPKASDKYILLGINMELVASTYIPAAEEELFNVATEWLKKNNSDTSVYDCKTNPILCAGYENGSHIASKELDLQVGQKVKLVNPTYFTDGRSSRIYGFEKKLDNKFECSYLVGETAAYSRLSSIESKIEEIQYKGGIFENVSIGGNGASVYLIKEFDDTTATDFNALSAKKTLKSFLRKDVKDVAEKEITFKEGLVAESSSHFKDGLVTDRVESEQFLSGAFGFGMKMWMQNGISYAEIDNLLVRRETVFNKLTIAELQSVGGQIVLSIANMECLRVEDMTDKYRCFFDNQNGAIPNKFAKYDQARCQTFDGAKAKYYWRLVVSVGADYIDLSKTDCDGTGVPETRDSIVQLGNRTDVSRRNALILSAYGTNAPSITQYEGIHNYSLDGCESTVISPKGNKFTGDFSIVSGSQKIKIPADKGIFIDGESYLYYDRVSHNGALWLCIVEEGKTTKETPTDSSPAWQKQVREGHDTVYVQIITDRGNIMLNGQLETTLTAVVYRGEVNISDQIAPNFFSWERTSSNPDGDIVFNESHKGYGKTLVVTSEDVVRRTQFDCIVNINF